MKCIDAEKLKQVVKTEKNIVGEITKEEYEKITGNIYRE